MGQIKNDTLLKDLALKIKELREKKGVTQEDFYNDTNIHIGRIETGRSNYSISTLEAICKYLDTSLKEIFSKLEH